MGIASYLSPTNNALAFCNHPDVTATDSEDYGVWSLQVVPIEGAMWIFKDSYSYTFTRLQFARKRSATYMQNAADDLFYNRVWVTELLDFSLISELTVLAINLWNANLGNTVSVTSFTDPGDAGVSIETITIPTVLQTNEDQNYDVTAFTTGPPEQYTIYGFTIAGLDYQVLVIGSRLLLFDFDINWERPERIIYEYFTSMYTAITGHEWRRGLADKVTRRNNLYLTFEGLETHRYLNTVRYARARFVLVPIYNEGFYSLNALTGAVAIEGAVDLTYHWNLQNAASYVLIVDHAAKISEAKTIVSINDNVITISKAVLNTFNPATAIVYPAFIAMVQDYSYRNITNKVIESNIVFQEVRPNG
jgi:hypothetical protein